MNNAHNPHDRRMYPGEAIELVLTEMECGNHTWEAQKIAMYAGTFCREAIQPWFVESHIKDLELQGWVFAVECGKVKVLTTGKGEG